MSSQPPTSPAGSGRAFERKLVDVRTVFHEALVRHLDEGRVVDKEKLEQTKLKVSASLVNFVVNGGVLLFSGTGREVPPDPAQLEDGHALSESELFHLLRETIYRMLGELNKPDVNLLKVSLARTFRDRLQKIFSDQQSSAAASFPVKIFQDFHDSEGYYIGINMRNTRSVGDDIDRIDRDQELKREIIAQARSCRHTDSNLIKLFSADLSRPGSIAG